MKVIIKADGEFAPELFEDGDVRDTHFKATDQADFDSKAAFLLFKRYGWSSITVFKPNTDSGSLAIMDMLQHKYFNINGENATEYVQYLPAALAEDDINSVLARVGGFRHFKELSLAGFSTHFAATTAYNWGLIQCNPDRGEIMEILTN